jgi:hypothetical protein
MNALIYILGYPYVVKTQVFNYKFDLKSNMWVNYFVFDGELLETWEIGQLMGGN